MKILFYNLFSVFWEKLFIVLDHFFHKQSDLRKNNQQLLSKQWQILLRTFQIKEKKQPWTVNPEPVNAPRNCQVIRPHSYINALNNHKLMVLTLKKHYYMHLQKGKFFLIVCKTFHSIRLFLSQTIRPKEKQSTIIVKTMTIIV